MKTKKTYAIVVGLLCLFVISASVCLTSCGKPEKEKQREQTVGGPTLKTLAKDSIHVALWAESKEDFEAKIGDTLSTARVPQTSFALNMKEFGSAFEFSWTDIKDRMRWQGGWNGKRDTIFNGKQKFDFVVIGSYDTSDPLILRFNGYVYAYKKNK